MIQCCWLLTCHTSLHVEAAAKSSPASSASRAPGRPRKANRPANAMENAMVGYSQKLPQKFVGFMPHLGLSTKSCSFNVFQGFLEGATNERSWQCQQDVGRNQRFKGSNPVQEQAVCRSSMLGRCQVSRLIVRKKQQIMKFQIVIHQKF